MLIPVWGPWMLPGEKECTIEDLTRAMERLSQMPQGDAVEIVNAVIDLCAMQLAAATATAQHRDLEPMMNGCYRWRSPNSLVAFEFGMLI